MLDSRQTAGNAATPRQLAFAWAGTPGSRPARARRPRRLARPAPLQLALSFVARPLALAGAMAVLAPRAAQVAPVAGAFAPAGAVALAAPRGALALALRALGLVLAPLTGAARLVVRAILALVALVAPAALVLAPLAPPSFSAASGGRLASGWPPRRGSRGPPSG